MHSLRPGAVSIIGAALLIAGGCVGIGMLALPMVTGLAGFFPSAIVFVIVAAFMLTTALLLAEIDGTFGRGSNLITITRTTLGRGGSLFTWIVYLFLFMSLMVAYVSKGGEITNSVLESWGISHLPPLIGPVLLVLLLLTAIFEGRWIVDIVNRVLMAGFFLAYLVLIERVMTYFSTANLLHHDEGLVFFTIPFLITTFGFHNLVPSLCDYLRRDRRAIVLSILIGTGLALLIYLMWILTVLGTIPVKGPGGINEGFNAGLISTELLANMANSQITRLTAIYLSVFAIVTSALAQGMGLVDFLLDGFQVRRSRRTRLLFALLVFIPVFLLSQQYPAAFFVGLELAGGIAAVCLFGVVPVVVAWKCRYSLNETKLHYLPGGKSALIVVGCFFIVVLGYEIVRQVIAASSLLG